MSIFARERASVTADLGYQASELEARALQLRAEGQSAWRNHLSESAQALREGGVYIGSVDQALLHYYGAELQDEVLTSLDHSSESDWSAFIEFAARVTSQEGFVPVVINSPQYVMYRDGSVEWREYMFALVDSDAPFYSIVTLLDESGRVIAPSDRERAVREMKILGLKGQYTTTDAPIEEDTVGCIESRGYASGGDGALIRLDSELRDGKVVRGLYGERQGYVNRVDTNSEMPVQYAVGWQDIEDMISSESTEERRTEAARKIGRYLLSSEVNPESVMPKMGALVSAVRALDAAART